MSTKVAEGKHRLHLKLPEHCLDFMDLMVMSHTNMWTGRGELLDSLVEADKDITASPLRGVVIDVGTETMEFLQSAAETYGVSMAEVVRRLIDREMGGGRF